ncbi:MAG: DinB family protein [Chloroflexi bacterium]|nr:DinB family protein [Chloroflexota bacterium]
MSAGTIPQAAFDRIDGVMKRALAGLTVEQLRTQPAGPESNPIGWIAWHLSRTHDTNFSNLLGQEQAWVAEQWFERFGLPADCGTGNGDSLDDVRAFDPIDAETTLGHWEAARARSRAFLEALTDADLDTPTPARPNAGPANTQETYKLTVARVTSDTFQHIGQIAYARGLVDRHGWYGV